MWTQRSAEAELNWVSLSWTDTNSHVVSYDSAGSVVCRVRFLLRLSDSATVRVKIIACGRCRTPREPELMDAVGDEPSIAEAPALGAEEAAEADDAQAWKAWRPPVLLAGPSTLRLPEFRRLITRLPEVGAAPPGKGTHDPCACAVGASPEANVPDRERP
jgi:hypothetical protein